jgi:Ca2+/Na+ antiporter
MIFVDPEGLDWLPLLFLLIAYGYVLFRASKLIADGSELLCLVLSPGLVGGLILPVMGAVPDGAIVLLSGMGEDAQSKLSVGVGTLAGSTIMLLTLPWAACGWLGRVELSRDGSRALYGAPLAPGKGFTHALFSTGVQTSAVVVPAARIMLLTAVTYLVIQGPAFALASASGTAADPAALGERERFYALAGFLLALVLFIANAWHSLTSAASEARQRARIVEARKRAVAAGLLRLTTLEAIEAESQAAGMAPGETSEASRAIVRRVFDRFDTDQSGSLDALEVAAMLQELKIPCNGPALREMMRELGGDDKLIQFDEFESLLKKLSASSAAAADAPRQRKRRGSSLQISGGGDGSGVKEPMLSGGAGAWGGDEEGAVGMAGGVPEEEEEEEEEVEEEETNLTPAQIRRKAVATLLLGVVLCTVFSDPMVDVLAEIAAKSGVPAFYVAFVIAPMISNASEIISSVMQAAKKRRANIDVTYSQLIGAATMNVRFCVRAVALRPLPHFLPSPCSLLPRPTTLRRRTRFASAFSSSLCLFGASRGSFPQRCFPFWSSSYSWRCLFSPARTRCSRCGKRLLRVCCSRCPSSLCLC